jgi:hypothetical protein
VDTLARLEQNLVKKERSLRFHPNGLRPPRGIELWSRSQTRSNRVEKRDLTEAVGDKVEAAKTVRLP